MAPNRVLSLMNSVFITKYRMRRNTANPLRSHKTKIDLVSVLHPSYKVTLAYVIITVYKKITSYENTMLKITIKITKGYF